jgi:hypothetical protein
MDRAAEQVTMVSSPRLECGLSDDELARLLIARMKEIRRCAHQDRYDGSLRVPGAVQ